MLKKQLSAVCLFTCIFASESTLAYQDGSGEQTWGGEEPALLELCRSCNLQGLLENTDHVDATDNDGNTALHLVVMSNSSKKTKIEAAQILLNRGIQPWNRNSDGETAEDLATARGWTRQERMQAFALMSGRIAGSHFTSVQL